LLGAEMTEDNYLSRLGIVNWSTLSEKFNNADLLLGNGFSINLGRFNYKNLFDEFLKSLTDDEREIFKSFKTNNFEFIQEKLLSAKEINKLFSIEDINGDIDNATNLLKKGLIKSIQKNHPTHDQINWKQLQSLSTQISNFKDIYTLTEVTPKS
jgi:hypothetical protein